MKKLRLGLGQRLTQMEELGSKSRRAFLPNLRSPPLSLPPSRFAISLLRRLFPLPLPLPAPHLSFFFIFSFQKCLSSCNFLPLFQLLFPFPSSPSSLSSLLSFPPFFPFPPTLQLCLNIFPFHSLGHIYIYICLGV